jgi:hypothetical protein
VCEPLDISLINTSKDPLLSVKYKQGKVHPRTDHEGPKGEQRYGSTLSLTSALDGGRGSECLAPATLPPGKTQYPFCRRLARPFWASAENLAPTRVWSLDHPAHSELLHWLHFSMIILVEDIPQCLKYINTTNHTGTPSWQNYIIWFGQMEYMYGLFY